MNGVWDYLLPIYEKHNDLSYSRSVNFAVADELKQAGLKPELAYIWGSAMERIAPPLKNAYICQNCRKETNYRFYARNTYGKRICVCSQCKTELKA